MHRLSWRIQRTALDHLNMILGSLSAFSAREMWTVGGSPVSDDATVVKGLIARYSC